MTPARLPIHTGSASLQGHRKRNEDASRIANGDAGRAGLLCVADGLGGHPWGRP
jgi:serine/threonine protein phosphatase PrpC